MNTKIKQPTWHVVLTAVMVFSFWSCERVVDGLDTPSYPTNPEVFIDGFSGGLNYAAFGGSVPTAFQVDNEVAYGNSKASMRIEVPDVNDSRGTYAGGVFFTSSPRDLSEYDALTFWAKSTQPVTIDVFGFGNDLGESRYQATVSDFNLNTNWKKYIIPIPNPSRLTAERGMFFYSVGPKEGTGFTFWIDEVKFEKLGTIAHPQSAIQNGQNQVVTSFQGVASNVTGLTSIHNLPNGVNQSVNITPAYFQFSSSNPSIATVDATGNVAVIGGPGTAVITGSIGNKTANGSLTIQSQGAYLNAPTPTRNPSNVISLFSEAYPNITVDYYNGYWEPFQTTQSADFTVNGDNVLQYTDFNFVGIQFTSPSVNATAMTHLHVDIFLPNPLPGSARFKIEMVDFGTGGTGAFTRTIPVTDSRKWISLDIPLSSFAGLTNRAQIAQIIFIDDTGNIPSFYADNIYFYRQ
jgi:hypothetical protein